MELVPSAGILTLKVSIHAVSVLSMVSEVPILLHHHWSAAEMSDSWILFLAVALMVIAAGLLLALLSLELLVGLSRGARRVELWTVYKLVHRIQRCSDIKKWLIIDVNFRIEVGGKDDQISARKSERIFATTTYR